MSDPVPVQETVREVYRFTPETLRHLKSKLPRPGVDATTTDLKAGFLLGIQHVLGMLEEGWTVK
jgi:hypothetical protein